MFQSIEINKVTLNPLMNPKILLIDDETNIRIIIKKLLSDDGFQTIEASSGEEGVRLFRKESPDAVLLDNRMPGLSGFETFDRLKEIDPNTPVVFLTAYGDVSEAVEAIKKGAYDFITKPPDFNRLVVVLKRAVEKCELQRNIRTLSRAIGKSIDLFFGSGEKARNLIDRIIQVANSDFSIIIQGETGTGKSTLAELIHKISPRAEGPYVRVDIGAIPRTLIESELFGYEKGAFTGADRARKGYFEAAHNGTIFIDELENMPFELQSKLLSAVEQKSIFLPGSSVPMKVDARVIAATNSDLERLIDEKLFREDLFYRLNEFMITIPPLRERISDIPVLAGQFLIKAASDLGRKEKSLSSGALEKLIHHGWPGNVRELKNVLRQAVLLCESNTLLPEHIHFSRKQVPAQLDADSLSLKKKAADASREAEIETIKKALVLSGGKKVKAAELLQVDYKTLLTKIKLYDLG